MTRRVVIDEDECTGCESCSELCPEAFSFDEASGKAKVINHDSAIACIQEAIETCPVECIQWVDE
jgi:ferredoxin